MEPLSNAVIKGLLAEVSDILEERSEQDRRQKHDPSNEFSQPDKDRRSGIDRRKQTKPKNT